MFKFQVALGILIFIAGIITSSPALALAAVMIVVLAIALKNAQQDYNDLVKAINNLDSTSHQPNVLESKNLTLSQKVIYSAAYQKGAQTIINKLKNLI
jgi:hypothetical protein